MEDLSLFNNFKSTKYIRQREGTRFEISRMGEKCNGEIRIESIHGNTFIFLKEKNIRNEFVGTLPVQDRDSLKKKKGEEENEEEFKRWNIEGGKRHDGLHSRKIGTCGRQENRRGNASRRIDSPLQIHY